jgi:long-chain acyl-CoA synthetase
MILGETLAYNARNMPDKEAFIFFDRRTTWKGLDDAANRFANALTKLGAKKGDRALMLVDNCIEFIEIYYGLAKIGVISAPSLPKAVGAEISYIANDLRAKFVIAERDGAPVIKEISDQLKSVEHVIGVGEGHGLELDYYEMLRNSSAEDPNVLIDPSDYLTIKYTSGTTGAPKGCIRSHNNFVMAGAVGLFEQPMFDDDTASISSPLAAGMAITEMSRFVIRGTRTVLLGRFDPAQYFEMIEREKITFGYAMDTMVRRFATHPGFQQANLSSLRTFSGSRDHESMELMRSQKTFHAGFHTGYGSSEGGGRISFKKPEDYQKTFDNPEKYGHLHDSLGREGRLFRMEAVDDDLRPVPVGEIGELAIRGPSVFQGYWERPEETAKVLRDGWLVTGDLIRRDEEGYLYMCGRKREMIKTGGINVYPAEIEPVLMSYGKVDQVAVVGIPDKDWGEKVVACVVAKEPMTEVELIDFCRDKLGGPKRPKNVVFMDKFPTNASGKVVKRELVDMLTPKN